MMDVAPFADGWKDDDVAGRHAQEPGPCPLCNGDGVITVRVDGKKGGAEETQTVECSTCEGTGEA